MKLTFSGEQEDKKNFCNQVYFEAVSLCDKGAFEVEFKKPDKKKTVDQLRGVYKLFQLSAPHFQRWKPKENWTLDKIKEFVKSELGYTRQITPFEAAMMIKLSGKKPVDNTERKNMYDFYLNGKVNISFADFTKEQLYNFTKEYEVWALTARDDKPIWDDVFLDDGDKKDLYGFK